MWLYFFDNTYGFFDIRRMRFNIVQNMGRLVDKRVQEAGIFRSAVYIDLHIRRVPDKTRIFTIRQPRRQVSLQCIRIEQHDRVNVAFGIENIIRRPAAAQVIYEVDRDQALLEHLLIMLREFSQIVADHAQLVLCRRIR